MKLALPEELASQFEIGQRGRTCTCGHPVPSRACCCYTTRWSPRRAWVHTGDFVSWGMRDPHTLNLCPAVRIEIGGPEGSGLPKPCESGAQMRTFASRIAMHPW